MKVFVSSTVYDLLDVRSEVRALLAEIGAIPIMSDESLSDFQIVPDVNAIETCLINVDAAEQFIIILDRRYGPSLESLGFGSFSATHLEYLRAAERKIPIHFFVRDRLEADFSIWRRNRKNSDVRLSWIQHAKDYGLFKLLEEHRKLEKRVPRSNWYTPFSDSHELKDIIRKRLGIAMLEESLVRAINENRFPFLEVSVETERVQVSGIAALSVVVKVRNIGGAPAFDFVSYWEAEEKEHSADPIILSAGQSTQRQTVVGSLAVKWVLKCSYKSILGVKVVERHEVRSRVENRGILISGSHCLEKRFQRTSPLTIKIEEIR